MAYLIIYLHRFICPKKKKSYVKVNTKKLPIVEGKDP